MTAWVDILNNQIVQNKPGTTSLIAALRDNPKALAEGDPTAPRIKPVILHVYEKQSSGTNNGGLVGGTIWHPRQFNTTNTNTITGASLDTTTGRITLPAGTYDVRGRVPGFSCGGHQTRIRNITDSLDQVIGSTSIASTAQTDSVIIGRFTIAAAKVFEVQHRCTDTNLNGRGLAVAFGLDNTFAEMIFEKVG